MGINVRIRDGLCPDPSTGEGGATEGDIRGSFSDIIDVIGVKDLAGGHCLVTQNSPAALSVLVSPGIVYIPNADYDELDSNQVRFWEAIVTVSTAVTITANTSGSARVDLVCAKMDTAVTPDEHASNIATLVAVAGTPGAGTPATPDNHYVLATVAVANGASTIVNADITSTRVQSKIDFDFLPKATGAEINTGTEDAKIVTPKSIADSYLGGATSNIQTQINVRADENGWTNPYQTWTRESDNSFSEPIDATLKYQKGDKIRYKQGAGYKYQYVISIGAYSGGKTIITTTGGSDYIFTSGTAITDNYYSHQENPIGFPAYFNFIPTWTGITLGNSTLNIGKFSLIGNIINYEVSLTIGSTGSVTGAIVAGLPVTITNSSDNGFIGKARLFSTGVGQWIGFLTPSSGKVKILSFYIDANTYPRNVDSSSTIPFTWKSTDIITFFGSGTW